MSKSDRGIVLSGPDKTIEARAKGLKLAVTVDPDLPLAYKKTLFVQPGTGVPWDLLPAAWHFLERWDAAVPLWRYGKTAEDVGTKAERKRTRAVVRDLRVLLHSVELLFVRDNEAGRALVEAYREEAPPQSPPSDGGEGRGVNLRLAFLRALYRVKPRVCVLPISWLAEVQARSKQDLRATIGQGRTMVKGGGGSLRRPRKRREPLVRVEVAPGRFVKCHKGDEEEVVRQFKERLALSRPGRRRGR